MNITAIGPCRNPLQATQFHPLMLHGAARKGPSLRAEAAEHRRMQRELNSAVATLAFDMVFKPRISLATGRMLGAEALPVWSHRRLGKLAAKTFMPVAEMSGLSGQIDRWALGSACATAARSWPSHWQVSVRISHRHLVNEGLVSQLTEILDATGLAPERLEIALDEAFLGDIEFDTLLTLSAVRDLGVGVSLDDFGSGHSSLSTLRRLPLTTLKLDRALISDLPDSQDDIAILRALASAGGALGFDIVANGIESEEQRHVLLASGCNAGQGNLFSKALSAAALSDWVAMT